jgi:hypothetical protein
MYHLPIAGLTHKEQDADGTCRLSAYRFHDEDPIVFQKGFVSPGETAKKKTANRMECRSTAEPPAMSGSTNGERVA